MLGMLQASGGDLQQAEATFRQLLRLHPGVAAAHNNLGHVLQLQDRVGEAVEHLQRALELRAGYPEAAYNLALAYTRQGRTEAAEAAYHQALQARPDFPEAHNNLANLLRGKGRSEAALGHYRQAVALRPGFADAHANLAVTLENLHRTDAARDAAQQALAVDPEHPVAGIVMAQLDRRVGHLVAARDRLERLSGLTALPPVQAAAVATELGHVLDRLGEPAAAFAAFTRGNVIWKQLLGPERASDEGYFQQVAQASRLFTAARVAGWTCAAPDDALPAPVFLVGFPRSGTTLTEEILGAHPGVITSHEQPILRRLIQEMPGVLGRAFDRQADLDTLSGEDIRQLRARYWALASEMVSAAVRKQRFIDKLPLNLVDLGLVRRLFPEARVIQVVRDPRDACLSCYMQSFQPNQAMVPFLDLARTARLCRQVMELADHYRSVLGLPWLVVRYEAVVGTPEDTARGLLSFLGLDWDGRVMRHHEAARTRYANTPSYQDVTSPLYKRAIGRWHNYRQFLAPVLGELQGVLDKYGY